MQDLIADIKRALCAEAYISALSLALVLPDICGQIEFPHSSSGKEQYIEWYDKHMLWPSDMTKEEILDGEKCYKLRCALLHSGNKSGVPVDEFELSIERISKQGDYSEFGAYGCSSFGSTWSTKDNGETFNKKHHIRLDVGQLCCWLCMGAEAFYDKWEDKSAFGAHTPNIIRI